MRYLYVLAAMTLILASLLVEAQSPKPGPDVVIAPLVVNDDALRAASSSCVEQLVAALKAKGVAVAFDPKLSDKNLRSAAAPWAVLGGLARKEKEFSLELQLLEVRTGDEMRSYFNSDKDPKLACRGVPKVAERIAVFVAEQKQPE